MPSKTLFAIGANIIVLAHVQAFVLLTANFEDVKKLASKFVSESIAEKIAEFVARATGNRIGMKTSKEDDSLKVKEPPIGSVSGSEEDRESERTKESISEENMRYKSKNIKSKSLKHKTRFESKLKKSSEKRSRKDRLKKEIKPKSKSNKKLKLKFISKSGKLDDFSEDSAVNNVSIESTAGWIEEGVFVKNQTSDQNESESEYVFRFNDNELRDERKGRKTRDKTTLTTRQEKNEFDQYDNTYYPKAVATSGSVTLRLFDSRKSRYRKD